MLKAPWRWRVILVRPRNPLNIGAAARAMANFGLSDLAVVEPYLASWREARSAVGAGAVMGAATAASSLVEAIADASIVLGTTSGHSRTLEQELISLDDLAAWLRLQARRASVKFRAQAAILFGSEKTGLSNDNLSYCHSVVRIPTAPECPSMNLGQAVAVCCHEIARLNGANAPRDPNETSGAEKRAEPERETQAQGLAPVRLRVSEPASIQSLEHVFERAVNVLEASGYLKRQSREAQILKLRRLLIGRRLSSHDAKILGAALAQIEWKLAQKGPSN